MYLPQWQPGRHAGEQAALPVSMNISVSVDDLAGGKRIECKDILEMLAVEGQIREAAITFKQVLDAAAHFGGEEVIEI